MECLAIMVAGHFPKKYRQVSTSSLTAPHHLIFLQARCSSWRQTYSVKSLKAWKYQQFMHQFNSQFLS